MLLLKKSPLDTGLFNLAYMDSPGESLSTTNLYHNILEGATILDNFEDSYNRIRVDYENFGYRIENYQQFEQIVKPFYQALRHGLSFDWVINYFVGEIVRYFPYAHFSKFSGTDPFVTSHIEDQVFLKEIGKCEGIFARMLDHIFVSGNTDVLRRLVNDSEQEGFMEGIQWAREAGKLDDYVVEEETLYRTNYLVALGMMLNDGVGLIKRDVWHNILDKIKNNEEGHSDVVLICGGKYRALAFGNLDGTEPKWHMLENGIRAIGATLDPLPNQSTNFRVTSNTVELDLTIVPQVQVGDLDYLDAVNFSRSNIGGVGAQVLKIKYPFNTAEGSIVELAAVNGCVIKDQAVALDATGVGETQIVFTGNEVAFTVSRKNSNLPFGNFINTEAFKATVVWL